jgi:hypothetical protein
MLVQSLSFAMSMAQVPIAADIVGAAVDIKLSPQLHYLPDFPPAAYFLVL